MFRHLPLVLLVGCASLGGLRELDTLPADFPLTIEGETGQITVPVGGTQVAVDVVFDEEAEARTTFEALQAQAAQQGFTVVEEGKQKKRDRVVLTGPKGKLDLQCCAARADRRQLVLVSWWPPGEGS
ncbi:MAG: hypothetical protein KC621_24720 [Myxococcales bacterium]|nr:hypothetical protein [Myxococcales bacterium]